MLLLVILDLSDGGFASCFQERNVVLDRTINEFEINAKIVVNQDVAESSQSRPIHARMYAFTASPSRRLDSANVCKLRMTPS